MDIKFTKFEKNDNWVTGIVVDNNGKELYFESKLFDEGSQFGINNGRVSKLNICFDKGLFWDNCIVNYDRGWDIKPDHDDDVEVFMEVLRFLEDAPKTRFE